MPFMTAINPKLYEKTCCSLLIISLQYAIISMSMYVLWWFIVYKFTVICIIYSKLLSHTSYVNIFYSKLLLTNQ